tara:strand:- start:1907 stop:2203 length:297 start_codon:yes stop_codon:yes gene_type:complete
MEVSKKCPTADSISLNSSQVPGIFNEKQDLQSTILNTSGRREIMTVSRTHLWQIWEISGGFPPHLRQISINHLKEGDFVFYASKVFSLSLLNLNYEII